MGLIPEGRAFCRHCGVTFEGSSHICPDGHLENRFVIGSNPGTGGNENIITLECGCTQARSGGWSAKLAQHIERGCCLPEPERCIAHGWQRPVRVDPYVALYLPLPT